ncbi:MAG: hypothetical protein LBC98_08985 [Prevotellaceae bacterium]|jgi:hypothetical protein|nr:hypothetical protein [Prevotellaceae bacterium]
MQNMIWVKGNPTPVKLSANDKEKLKRQITAELEKYPELKKRVNRVEIKAGRIYFYELIEAKPLPQGAHYIVPLIDGKWLEFILARITIYISNCTLDFQRHNNQWMTIDSGTLEECIEKIENGGWFAAME